MYRLLLSPNSKNEELFLADCKLLFLHVLEAGVCPADILLDADDVALRHQDW